MSPAERIIAAVRSRGNDADDLRDAAHEAAHGLQAGHRGSWEREALHKALVSTHRTGDLVRLEIEARAVEQVVCAELKVECWTVDHAASITWFETVKNMHINLPDPTWVAQCIHKTIPLVGTKLLAKRVMALRPLRRSP